MDITSIVWIIILLLLIQLLQLSQLLVLGPPSDWLLCPLNMPPSYFEYSLTGTRCSGLILYFTCSPLVLFIAKQDLENKIWVLIVLIATCIIASRTSQQTKLGNTYMYS